MVFSIQAIAEEEGQGFSFKKLMMPGELSSAHAEYEAQCGQCHVGFKRQADTQLCLNCHEETQADITQKKGYHGRIDNSQSMQCRSCHTEHIGRNADITGLNKDLFDHQLSDFLLEGAHQKTECSACHISGTPFREAPTVCVDCHRKKDIHRGSLGDMCQDCHNSNTWKDTEFDHSKTDFPLKGQHKPVRCSACHLTTDYDNTPQTCVACHQLNDVHNGVNGKQCAKCHNEAGWKKTSFDHNKNTRFNLIGGHDNLMCTSCHQSSGFEEKLSTACYSCHKNNDEHRGRNGQQCASCHSVYSWQKILFDHNTKTNFPLSGKHKDINCESCHITGTKKVNLGTQCIDCHKNDDVHQGNQGVQCNRCHNTKNWTNQVKFDHDLTEFPLLGMHIITHCEFCHQSKVFSEANSQCVNCHGNDDIHNGALGPSCNSCHTPNGWKLWFFDHSAQTNFTLDGAHENLTCNACHTEPTQGKVKQSPACISCHLSDDAHNRQFGRDCDRCHTTQSFTTLRVQ